MMGTRLNALFDHDLADWRHREAVLARLERTRSEANTVRDYWLAADPNLTHGFLTEWTADPISSIDIVQHRYSGPGSLFVTVTPAVVMIRGGARWRGFLSIGALRIVHLAAIRSIAVAFGASRIAVYSDSCEVNDLVWSGQTFAECVDKLEQIRGLPRTDLDRMDRRIAAEAEDGIPEVWYLERRQSESE